MTRLSEGTKHQIIALRDSGMSWGKIALQLLLSRSTVCYVYAKKIATGDVCNKKAEGRPRKVTLSAERLIRRDVKRHRTSTIPEFTAHYNNGRSSGDKISCITMRRTLKRIRLSKRSAARKLQISLFARTMRVRWCRQHANMTAADWKRIIFTDEVRIGFRNDGRIKVWRSIGERFSPGCTTSTSTARASLMFWGFISWDGAGFLLPCTNHMSANEYIHKLENAAIPCLSSFGLTLMDDNAPIHRARAVQSWKEENGVTTIAWPPYSPDCNPIENVWGFMKVGLKKISPQPSTLHDLHREVLLVWNALELAYIQRLYDSIPRRLQKCIRNRGYPIPY
jgi:transposase